MHVYVHTLPVGKIIWKLRKETFGLFVIGNKLLKSFITLIQHITYQAGISPIVNRSVFNEECLIMATSSKS